MVELLRRAGWYVKIMADGRTPWSARLLLIAAGAYLLFPTDLVADIVPAVGLLDDASVVALLIWLSLRLVPPEVLRGKKNG